MAWKLRYSWCADNSGERLDNVWKRDVDTEVTSMQKSVRAPVLSIIIFAGPVAALPVLSADNSVPSGVEVEGVLYDATNY